MQFIGSVGTLIGSAMETSGHYLQSEMLNILQLGLTSSLGGFIFMIAGISAIFQLAVGGEYKFGLWFLFGAPLFFFIVNTRVPSEGADWTFGSRTHKQELVEKATSGVTTEDATFSKPSIFPSMVDPETPPKMQVSWIFMRWNQIVSSTVNQFVELLQVTNFKSDLTFLDKGDKYKALFNLRVMDPQLKIFTNIALFDKCGEYFVLKRYIYDSSIGGTAQQQQLKDRVEKISKSVRFSLNDYPEIRNWFAQAGYQNDLESVVGKRTTLSCDELWKVGINVYKNHSKDLINSLARSGLPEGMSAYEYKKKLAQKFKQNINPVDGSVDSSSSLNDEQAFVLMNNEIAARMLMSEMSEITPGVAQLGMDKNVRTRELIGRDIADDTQHSIRQISKREEFQGKGDFITMALTLPYIQGMALYFLAATFPFFAMALILPGRHGVFLLWMAMWVWIKSWDFGFGVVMILDEILYYLMPHGPAFTDDVTYDPGQAYKTLLEVDPTYSVHTYYNILATCMAAVPVVTYALVKKGGDEVVSAIQQGYQKFSGRIGESMAAYQANIITQGKFAESARQIYSSIDKAANQTLQDPFIMKHLTRSVAANITNSISKAAQTGTFTGQTMNQIFGAATAVAQSYDQRMAIAMFKSNLQDAMYKESFKKENLQRAHDGLLVKWYSHDFSMDPPTETRLELIKEKYHLDFAKQVDGIANSALGTVTNALPKK
jgi:hypothetical protein